MSVYGDAESEIKAILAEIERNEYPATDYINSLMMVVVNVVRDLGVNTEQNLIDTALRNSVVMGFIMDNKKIMAIKELRQHTLCTITDAKSAIDKVSHTLQPLIDSMK